MNQPKTANIKFHNYEKSVPEALDTINAGALLKECSKIMLKPNLINASPHPVTTNVRCCAVIVDYIRKYCQAEIVIAEGCGDVSMETMEVFQALGYDRLSEQKSIKLLDLNHAPLQHLHNPKCKVFPEIYLPRVVFTHFMISVPVLKAHSLADITGSLKNMMGLAPPAHYSGTHGVWKKSVFHQQMHQSIIDLNTYRSPDLTLLDASVGLAEYHLGGPECHPPAGRILSGIDPRAVDRLAAGLLGLDWRMIGHLC